MNRTQLSFRRRRIVGVSMLLSTCVVVAFALAHEPDPASRPGDQHPPRHDGRVDHGPPPPREGPMGERPDRNFEAERLSRMGIGMGIAPRSNPRFSRWMPGPDEKISDEEWSAVVTFMSERSPTRYKLFKRVEAEKGADSPAVKTLKARGIGLCRMLDDARKSSPRTYEFALRQIQIEDEIIAALDDLRAGESSAKRDKLNGATRKFIKNNLDEREAWLKMLEESIARQKAELANDRSNIDDLARRRSEIFEREFNHVIDRLGEEYEDRPPHPED